MALLNPKFKEKGAKQKMVGYFESFLLENNQGILWIDVYAFFILNDWSKIDKDIEPMTSKVVNVGNLKVKIRCCRVWCAFATCLSDKLLNDFDLGKFVWAIP